MKILVNSVIGVQRGQWRARLSRTGASGLAAAALALIATPVWAGAGPLDCRAISGKNRVALVELYTSEGCSSCPPADKWLSALQSSGMGSDQVLALALHVDYWDYIGWKDRFADPSFTDRQREVAYRNRLRTIYTPQVVLDGQDFSNWWEAGAFIGRVGKVNGAPAPIRLELSGQWSPSGKADANVAVKASAASGPTKSLAGTRLFVALFEDSLQSKVSRGENAGETLKHDKVVRRWLKPVPLDAQGNGSLMRSVSLPKDAKPGKMGIAAFAQGNDGRVVQAVSCQFMGTS